MTLRNTQSEVFVVSLVLLLMLLSFSQSYPASIRRFLRGLVTVTCLPHRSTSTRSALRPRNRSKLNWETSGRKVEEISCWCATSFREELNKKTAPKSSYSKHLGPQSKESANPSSRTKPPNLIQKDITLPTKKKQNTQPPLLHALEVTPAVAQPAMTKRPCEVVTHESLIPLLGSGKADRPVGWWWFLFVYKVVRFCV